jgi:hypothetical protein
LDNFDTLKTTNQSNINSKTRYFYGSTGKRPGTLTNLNMELTWRPSCPPLCARQATS